MTDRSYLFVPGDDVDAIDSAKQSKTDAIIVDLEDTVLGPDKDAARRNAKRAIENWVADDPTLLIRVNGVDTPFGIADVDALLECTGEPHALVLPDVRDQTDTRIVADRLDARGSTIGLVPLIERPEAVFHAFDIARASTRTIALAFGSVDFRMNTGMSVVDTGTDVSLPRYLVSMAASAIGRPALDTVYLNRKDTAGLLAETREARAMGFDAKMAIAESQVSTIHDGFAPTDEELNRARRLVDAFETAETGVVYFEGTFVDQPVVDEQRALLNRERP